MMMLIEGFFDLVGLQADAMIATALMAVLRKCTVKASASVGCLYAVCMKTRRGEERIKVKLSFSEPRIPGFQVVGKGVFMKLPMRKGRLQSPSLSPYSP